MKRPPIGDALAKSRPRPELITFVNAIRALEVGSTRAEIQDQTGMAHHVVSRLLRVMHKELRMIRVCEWQTRPDGMGTKSQVFQIGRGPDARKPPPIKEAARSKARRIADQQQTAMVRLLGAIHGIAPVQKNGIQTYNTLGRSRWDV